MATNFLRERETDDNDTSNKTTFEKVNPDMFKKIEKENNQTNIFKGLSEVSFENDPVLVPLQRTEFKEIMIALQNMSVTIEGLLKQTGDIEKNILLTENNNNISDSETKKFIEMTVNKSLENFKNFIMTKSFETSKNEEIDDLEPNDIIIIVNDAPSKQMLKISSDTAKDIINDILGKGGQCYITDNKSKASLSEQIKEIKQTETSGRKEGTDFRKERLSISSTFSEDEKTQLPEDEDKSDD